MNIYWTFLILSLFICSWCSKSYNLVEIEGRLEKRGEKKQGWIFFAPIIFFTGLRSYVGDTGTYIGMFESYPNIFVLSGLSEVKDVGFYFLSVLYKQYVSTDYQGWLFVIALVSCIATMKGFLRYSEDFGMTCFLFISSTMFTYLLNGMRQYICVAILFAYTYLVIERRYFATVLLVLLMSTIHGSALLFLLIFPMVDSKPWSIRMILISIVFFFFAMNFEVLFPSVGMVLEKTQYAGYVDYINNSGVGSNIIRLLIASIPVLIAFYGRHVIEFEGNKFIKICVNMSVVNMCIYMIATVSSGMAVGRAAAYFEMYNLILLPWLINHVFSGPTRKIVRLSCFALYIVYFWYQMVVTWHLSYGSDFLGIQYRWY